MRLAKVKQWLWLQKEGIAIGLGWGILAMYTLPFYFPQTHLSFLDKIVLFPVWSTNILFESATAPLAYFIPPVIGAVVGAIVDSIYKPKE